MDLYNLKFRYGKPGTLSLKSSVTPNYARGSATSTVAEVKINRIIKCGQSISLKQLAAFLNAKISDSMYQNEELFLIDTKDLPNGVAVGSKDWIEVSEGRFEISRLNLIEPANVIFAYCLRVIESNG